MPLMDNGTELLNQGPVWSAQKARAEASEIRKIEEEHRRTLEDHKASLLTGLGGSWRFETGTGVGLAMLSDVMQEYDPAFNISDAMAADSVEFPEYNKPEQDLLKTARNSVHYNNLKQRLRDKREFQLNSEDLGIIPSMAIQMVAETANIPNYFTFGLGNLNKVGLMKRFLAAGVITGSANVAEEAFINKMYNDRTASDYAVAGALGLGLGWLGTLGGKDPNIASHMDEVGSAFANTHIKNSVDEAAGETLHSRFKNDVPGAEQAFTKEGSGETLRDRFYGSTVGSGQIKRPSELFDPDNPNRPNTPWMDEDADIVQATYQAVLNGDVPQASKLVHEKFGLASMAQSMHSSPNPITRYMASILFEHPEGSGYKQHTASLQSDLDFQYFSAGYMRGYVDFKREWNVLAESKGILDPFDEVASLWVSGSKHLPDMDVDMAKILDDFNKHYTEWNDWTYKKMHDAGVLEAKEMTYDPNHIYRGWDGKKVHKLRSQYGDDAVIETFMGSIKEGKKFREAQDAATKAFEKEADDALKLHLAELKSMTDELETLRKELDGLDNSLSTHGMYLAGKIEKLARSIEESKKSAPSGKYVPPDSDLEIRRIAEAFYHRFLRRATVSTADANLLSTANRGLLKDMLKDIKMEDADYRHLEAVIDTLGKDQKANPMKHKTSMDLGYQHPSGLKIMDMMHTDLGSAYASKQRYWIGRAAAAKRGIPSDEAFHAAIEEVKKHGSDRGMDAKDITADVARLEAGWKLINGIPVEDMDHFGQKAMRFTRKLAQVSMLEKLGITQLGELGRVMSASGVTNLMDSIPFIKDMIMDLKDGRLNTAMLKDFEDAFLGTIGDEHYMNHPDFRVDDFGHAIGKYEKMLDSAGYWLQSASGWRLVYTQQKKILMNYLGRRFYDWFVNGKMTEAQMNDLGVPPHQIDRIKEAMLKHVEFDDNGILKSYHLNDWDPDIRETIGLMLHRKSSNAIQDILVGETPLWLNTGLGKFLGQFKTFSIAALGKQTIHDWNMYKQGDMEAALAFQFMFASSTLALAARIGFNSLAMPNGERADYLKNSLNPKALSKALLAYHGQTGPLMDITDMLASTVMPDTWGNITGNTYRQRTVFARIPGLSYIDTVARGVAGASHALNPYRDMSHSDWNAIVGTIPLSGWYGFHALNKGVLEPAIFYKDRK